MCASYRFILALKSKERKWNLESLLHSLVSGYSAVETLLESCLVSEKSIECVYGVIQTDRTSNFYKLVLNVFKNLFRSEVVSLEWLKFS